MKLFLNKVFINFLEREGILPEEQKGCCKGRVGTKYERAVNLQGYS